ncbi:MAG: sulfotransferase [Planctomycetota bacterium]
MDPIDAFTRRFTSEDLAPLPAGWRVGPPDFVGVGCGKAGSTWWYHLLCQHPAVVPNRLGLKELVFFSHGGWRRPTDADLELYRSVFARPPGHLCGDWTANYLYAPFALDALALAAPDAKLILTVRNPVDRFVSMLNQFTLHRAELVGATGRGRTVLETWSLFPEAAHQSRIAEGVERMLRLFPREQIHVVQYERAKASPHAEFARTLRFLGLDDRWVPQDAARPVHKNRYVVERPSGGDREWIADWFRDDVERTAALLPEVDPGLWDDFASPVAVGAAVTARG